MANSSSFIPVSPDALPPTFTRVDLDRYDTILFDLDGCVWDQYKFYNFSKETLETLAGMGKRLIFCSNNAVMHHTDMMRYFEKNGMTITFPAHFHSHRKNKDKKMGEGSTDDAAHTLAAEDWVPQQLYTSAFATAAWCEKWFCEQGFDADTDKVVFCGEEGFFREMLDHGFRRENIINVADVAAGVKDLADLVGMNLDPAAKCVVTGFNKTYTYVQSAILTRYLHEMQIPLISTNPDVSFSLPGNRILPEFGGFVLQLEATVGTKALVSCGKPNAAMFDQIKSDVAEYCRAQSTASVGRPKEMEESRTLMVGDNLLTDIVFGINAGVDTLLVYSGVTQAPFIDQPQSATADDSQAQRVPNPNPTAAHTLMNKHQIKPTFVAPNIKALIGGS